MGVLHHHEGDSDTQNILKVLKLQERFVGIFLYCSHLWDLLTSLKQAFVNSTGKVLLAMFDRRRFGKNLQPGPQNI